MAEVDKEYDRVRSKADHSTKARGVLRGAGYARGGGVGARAKKAVHKHEGHLHKGEEKTKLKKGGKVDGKKPAARPDKMARGGSKPRGHTKININVGAGQQEKQQAMQQGMQLGAKMAAQKMAAAGGGMGGPRPGAGAPMQGRPGMPPPGAGGPPPGAAPGGPPMQRPPMAPPGQPGMKRGGKVGPKRVEGVPHLTGGGGGAQGRLDKQKEYGTKPKK